MWSDKGPYMIMRTTLLNPKVIVIINTPHISLILQTRVKITFDPMGILKQMSLSRVISTRPEAI